jgi:8-oxo-dGTP pyrophosphatase MutT (NUDIX family)
MTENELKSRIQNRIGFEINARQRALRGDHDLNPDPSGTSTGQRALKPAAVLIPIIERTGGMQVLFTRRADHLARHAGQVSFPGGRVNDGEVNALDAALRETEEEVGLPRQFVTICGDLDMYETGTGFSIHPFVGMVREGFELKIDPAEVAEVFEVPLVYLMDQRNHEQRSAIWQGRERRYYAMTYGRHYIWGATAGILINLYECLYG